MEQKKRSEGERCRCSAAPQCAPSAATPCDLGSRHRRSSRPCSSRSRPPPKPRLPPLNPLRHSPLIKIQGRMKKSVVPIATPTERCLRLKCHWSACESKIGAARLGRCCKVRKSLREFLTRTKQRQKNKMVQFHVKLNDLLGVLRFTLVFWYQGFESNC